MKLSHYIAASFVLSLLVHLILLMSLSNMKISSPVPVTLERERKPLNISVWPEKRIKLPEKKVDSKEGKQSKLDTQTRENSEKAIREIFEKQHLALQEPKPEARFSGIEKEKITPRLPSASEVQKATAPRPKIVEIDVAKLPTERIGKRVVVPQANREDISEINLPSLLPEGPLTKGAGPVYDVGIKLSAPKFGLPPEIPEDAPIGGMGSALDNVGLGDNALKRNGPSNGEALPFDQFVNTSIVIKDMPDGSGYFMLQISANDRSESVREIPKDVMLIIDRSSSISFKKFRVFKDAAKASLEYLNPQDRFNIVTFTDKAIPFSNAYVQATPQNCQRARNFVEKLSKGGMTNLFDGLYPFVKNTSSQDGRPLNIFMLTDGIATVNIYKDDDFIRQVTGINPGHVSIFPFCAGDSTGQDLLDFLGFLNRGKCNHAEKIQDIRDNLTNFITEHCNLLIRDLEYIAEGSIADTVYPRKLQHLYRGGNVTLYGKFQPDDKELVITLLGRDYENKLRDIVLRFNLANCRRTDLPIDKQWAATKILHIVADRTLATDKEAKDRFTNDIKNLAVKFNLSVPY